MEQERKIVMRCKLVCTYSMASTYQDPNEPCSQQISMAAVWEGTTEDQQRSENAIFGKMTPSARFDATLKNPEVVANLKQGKSYYVEFIEVED